MSAGSVTGYQRYQDTKLVGARLAAVASGAPTNEIGTPFDGYNIPFLQPGARDQALLNLAQAEDLEQVPELMHPNSVVTYRNMRNDAQMDALYRGTTMPVTRYKWMIDENGCDPAKVQKLAADLGV